MDVIVQSKAVRLHHPCDIIGLCFALRFVKRRDDPYLTGREYGILNPPILIPYLCRIVVIRRVRVSSLMCIRQLGRIKCIVCQRHMDYAVFFLIWFIAAEPAPLEFFIGHLKAPLSSISTAHPFQVWIRRYEIIVWCRIRRLCSARQIPSILLIIRSPHISHKFVRAPNHGFELPRHILPLTRSIIMESGLQMEVEFKGVAFFRERAAFQAMILIDSLNHDPYAIRAHTAIPGSRP